VDAAIASAGLIGLVRRTGYCADMPAALLAASVVVVPSTQPEAFGRVAAEAEAMGTPVVVSDLGALPEVVLAPPDVEAAARTGWRVKPGDARALAAAVIEALALGATARDDLSGRARSHILDRFSVTRMQAETLEAYAALLA
jgi:glycosyltransferase involved in cell wall biosynthesis